MTIAVSARRAIGQDDLMANDDSDDPTKTPIFKIATWFVLAIAVIGIVLTLILS